MNLEEEYVITQEELIERLLKQNESLFEIGETYKEFLKEEDLPEMEEDLFTERIVKIYGMIQDNLRFIKVAEIEDDYLVYVSNVRGDLSCFRVNKDEKQKYYSDEKYRNNMIG